MEHGDSPMAPRFQFAWNELVSHAWRFTNPPQRVVAFNDTMAVLLVLMEKVRREGYREWGIRFQPDRFVGRWGLASLDQ